MCGREINFNKRHEELAMTKTARMIAALEVELMAAMATKDAANAVMDEDRFYAACERVRSIELEIRFAIRGKSKTCSNARELVSNNAD